MDTTTLVEEQLEEGKRFVDHLNSVGFDVDIAFWACTSDDGVWRLYLSSPTVDKATLAEFYRKLYPELSRSNVHWISLADIKLVASDDAVAIEAKKFQHRIAGSTSGGHAASTSGGRTVSTSGGRAATKFGGRKLGNLIVDEAYIYPKSI